MSANAIKTYDSLMILSLRGRRRAARDRVGGDAREFRFDLTQILKQSIELGRPPQVLALVELGEHDSAGLRELDDIRGVETAHSGILAAELHDYALQPVLLCLPVAERMRLKQVIDSSRFGRRAADRNSRRICVTERFALEDL